MGLFFRSSNSDSGDYDFDRLRRDLVDEYGIQSAAFSGGLGFLDMCDAENASNEQLIEMARKEGFNLNKYKR
ncbi:MAG: hypothetical protein J6M45_02500 [Pseudobutyrivibrio sp.]|nr:hypothetical protein [Pseudobutyrivibrio sp.]